MVGLNDELVEELGEADRRLAKLEVLDDNAAEVDLGARHVDDDVVVGGVGDARSAIPCRRRRST